MQMELVGTVEGQRRHARRVADCYAQNTVFFTLVCQIGFSAIFDLLCIIWQTPDGRPPLFAILGNLDAVLNIDD